MSIIIGASVITFLISIIGMVYAQSPFELGYNHGCDDAKIIDEKKQYITQQGLGVINHLPEFMEGYRIGYQDCYKPSTIEYNNMKISDKNFHPITIFTNENNTFNIQSIFKNITFFFGILVFVLFVVILLITKHRVKRKSKIRMGFSVRVKYKILKKQDHKCAFCKRLLNVVDYDHKNGNRSDNREKNCQALCPNCHAIKTRKELSKDRQDIHHKKSFLY